MGSTFQLDPRDATRALEQTLTPIMMVDSDFVVVFVNRSTQALLAEHEAAFREVWPDFKADEIIGTCIDRFHKDPSHQRKLLNDPQNLPVRTDIRVGHLTFRLHVSGRFSEDGELMGHALEWLDVTVLRQKEREAHLLSLAIDQAQTAIMMVDRDFMITYANEATKALLRQHEAAFAEVWPDFKADSVMGTCIDRFHRSPEHQRKLLADPANLPFRTDIRIGELIFTLQVSGQFDHDGKLAGHTLEWYDVTEDRARQQENERFAAVAAATARGFAIVHLTPEGTILTANDRYLTATGYARHEVEGKHHRMLCRPEYAASPAYAAFWRDLQAGKPLSAEVNRVTKSGQSIWLQASYLPIIDTSGAVTEVVKLCFDVTETVEARTRFKETAAALASASTELRGQSADLVKDVSSVAETSQQAKASLEVSDSHVRSMNEATKEMAISISEIASSAANAARVASSAVKTVSDVHGTVSELTERSVEISKVVNTIASVAAQTNLLALNATIEAARAGEAGKGFAVVASEVKELAKGTARSTEDITRQVDEIRGAAEAAAEAMTAITQVIEEINDYQATIASAVEEQSATTKEIGRSMDEVTSRSSSVVTSMNELQELALSATGAAQAVDRAAEGLAEVGIKLSPSKDDTAESTSAPEQRL